MELRHGVLPIDDAARVAALHELGALDQPSNPDLDAITRLAAFVCGSSGAALNLIDADRQWQASVHGVDPVQVPREDAMCARSILFPDQVTYTPDASQESGFADNPYVTGQLAAIRMYAAAPVLLDSGHVVGTLCVFDEQVRTLEAAQLERLHDLAAAAARILQLRRRVDTLAHAATTDALTGVRNRGYLVESLRDALQRWARGVRRPGVLYIDLDGFKAINDEHGHSVGDAVLRAVAERLQGNVRAHDVVARLGGDEFAIVMEDAPEHLEARLADVAERIEDALTDPVDLEDGNSVSAHASVGASVAEQPSDTVTSLLSRADAAMYAAKAQPDRDVS